jgi:hypothetical protein
MCANWDSGMRLLFGILVCGTLMCLSGCFGGEREAMQREEEKSRNNLQKIQEAYERFEQNNDPADYYPLQVGMTWHYRATFGDQKPRSVVVRATGEEEFEGKKCVVLDYDAKNIRLMRVEKDGVYWHRKAYPAVLILKLPPRAGEQWIVDYKTPTPVPEQVKETYSVATAEEVTVPAGKFSALRVTVDYASRPGDFPDTTIRQQYRFWYAPEAGLVKMTLADGNGRTIATSELEKFEKPLVQARPAGMRRADMPGRMPPGRPGSDGARRGQNLQELQEAYDRFEKKKEPSESARPDQK